MPCRDHGKACEIFSQAFSVVPWGTPHSSGKVFPETPSVAAAPDTCEIFSQAFSVVPGGTSYSSGKGFPEAPSVADAPDTCESLAGFFRGPLGDFLFIGERLPVYGVSPCLISMQKRKSVLLLRPCLDDLRAGRNIVGQPDVASDDAVVADSDPSQDRGV